MTKKILDPVRAYLSVIGKKGGSVSSQAKTDAAKRRTTTGRPKGAKDRHPRKTRKQATHG